MTNEAASILALSSSIQTFYIICLHNLSITKDHFVHPKKSDKSLPSVKYWNGSGNEVVSRQQTVVTKHREIGFIGPSEKHVE